MTYLEAIELRDQCEAEVAARSAVLNTFPKGALGLTPDTVKASPAYRDAKAAYNLAFAALRAINTRLVKLRKAEG